MSLVLMGALGMMMVFAFGRLAFALGRRRRWRRCGGRYGRHGGPGGPGGLGEERFARAAGEVMKRRLRIDEEQEPVVDHALRDLRATMTELTRELGETRAAAAEAFRGEAVDDAALAATFARQDDAVARARRDVVSALKQVHAVLQPDQRAKAADWMGSARPRWM